MIQWEYLNALWYADIFGMELLHSMQKFSACTTIYPQSTFVVMLVGMESVSDGQIPIMIEI